MLHRGRHIVPAETQNDFADGHAILLVKPSEHSAQRLRLDVAVNSGTGAESLEQPSTNPRFGKPSTMGLKIRGVAWSSSPIVLAFAYLCTGTTLAVMGQLVVQQGAAATQAHLPAFTKYITSFALSLGLHGIGSLTSQPSSKSRVAASACRKQRTSARLTWAVGVMDVVAYALNCLGFARCGSSLSMVVFAACGQVFTALTRAVLLRRSNSRTQYFAVALVVLGLAIRTSGATPSSPHTPSSNTNTDSSHSTQSMARHLMGLKQLPWDPDAAFGLACIAASALCYSLVGVLYEWLAMVQGPSMNHVQVSAQTSAIGLAASSIYLALYVWPRREALVLQHMQQRGLTAAPVLKLHASFGGLFTLHGWVQAHVLAHSGAATVGIVSALRAATVTLSSAALFCSSSSPGQCLTRASGGGAAVVTAGAVLWALGRPKTPHSLSNGKDSTSQPRASQGFPALMHMSTDTGTHKAKEL